MTAASVYPSSLAYGKISQEHPLASFLTDHGVTREEIAWFERHSARPDILGTNYYSDIAKFEREGDFTRKGSVPLDQAASEAAILVKAALANAQAYFSLPVYLMETSAGLSTDAKIAYINALYQMILAFSQGREIRSTDGGRTYGRLRPRSLVDPIPIAIVQGYRSIIGGRRHRLKLMLFNNQVALIG